MKYRRSVLKSKNFVHVTEFTKPGYCRGKRGVRHRTTTESMKSSNHRRKEMKVLDKLLTYFADTDLMITLTYDFFNRPADMNECKKDFAKFRRILAKEYKTQGYTLHWIRNIEKPESGAWHIHMAVTNIPDSRHIIEAAWPHGYVNIKRLNLTDLSLERAVYLTKEPFNNECLEETSFSSSRNMPLEEPEKADFSVWEDIADIKVPAGYYLDKHCYICNENSTTGYRYRSYVFHRIVKLE